MKKILIGTIAFLFFLVVLPMEKTAISVKAIEVDLEQDLREQDPFFYLSEMSQQSLNVEKDRLERTLELERLEAEAALKLAEELAAKEKEEKHAEEKVPSKQEVKKSESKKNDKSPTPTGEELIFKLSFYSDLPEENGGYSQLANGESIYSAQNAVASNYYKIGTKIYLEGWGIMTVKDRGGSAFNSSNRLDVLIHRKDGESNSAYRARISTLGRQTTSGYIVK